MKGVKEKDENYTPALFGQKSMMIPKPCVIVVKTVPMNAQWTSKGEKMLEVDHQTKSDFIGLDKIMKNVDQELKEEEYEKIKEDTKKVVRQNYYKMNMRRKFIQGIKCIFGRHLFNWIPSMDITTCPCCTRIWNGRKSARKREHIIHINGSIVGYDDYEKRKGQPWKGDLTCLKENNS